jgi:hypothetical protein
MKLMAMMAMAAVMGAATGTTAWSDEIGGANEGNDRKVMVCMEHGTDAITVSRAQAIASRMFGEIGVKIEWYGHSPCPAEALRISLSIGTPASLLPGALAYALPYEGTHIVVFYDRVQRGVARQDVQVLLAHVLVHEITHIVEGVSRHSASGVMKARWSRADVTEMLCKPLGFAEEDVTLIHDGLDAQASRRAGSALIAINVLPR